VPRLEKRKTRKIGIPETGFPLMRQHLKFVDAGRPGIYVDWSWNGNVGWVGVTDAELCAIVAGKAEKAKTNHSGDLLDEQWLIVHGGWSVSQFLEPLNTEQLQSFAGLTDLLSRGPFARVYLLGSSTYCWMSATGWRMVSGAPPIS
jgi:hypothetical protein